MADILLIQPLTSLQDKLQTHPSPPLSLLSISTFLQNDYEIKILDERVEKNFKKKLKKELNKNPICVGITVAMGRQVKNALLISKFIKEIAPEIPVVWGGVFPTLLPQQSLESKYIDIVVRGEGEITFFELVKALEKGKKLKRLLGIWYKENGQIKQNPDRKFVDLNKLPDIPYHLINVRNYMPRYSGKRTFYVETSRGCPYACTFCYVQSFHKRCWRGLSAEKALEKIRRLKDDFNVKNFWLVDDNFFVDLKRAKEIMNGLKNFDITWEVTGSRADIIYKAGRGYLTLLEKSGCRIISFGIESGSQRILNLVKKGIDLAEVVKLNKLLSTTEITPIYNFMTGFPTETTSDIKKTIQLALKLLTENSKSKISTIKILTPFPGTEIFERALKEGFKPPSTLEGWTNFNWDNVNLPWISKERKRILEKLYFISAFLSEKLQREGKSEVLRILAEVYKPIAFYRMKNFCFKCMPEFFFKDFFFKF